MKTPLRTLVLLAVWLPACAPATSDTDAAIAELRAAADAYQSAASSKDAAAVVSLYAEDAVLVPPDADWVRGSEEVAGYRFGFIETPGVELDFELVRAEVAASGDLGWTLALVRITIPQEAGPPARDLVRDLHTWRRGPDGAWRVVADIWSSAGPQG